jgi:hypothetical protein
VNFVMLLACAGLPSAGFAAELISNGGFEEGTKDVSSDYKFVRSTILQAATYDIVRSPHDCHRDAPDFGDHTTGKGRMMVVNGTDLPSQCIWSQTVEVRPDSDYVVSVWAAPWVQFDRAEVEIRINGKPIASMQMPEKLGEWQKLEAHWKSNNGTGAKIELFNTRGAIAIDDISFKGPRLLPDEASDEIASATKDVEKINAKAAAEVDARELKLLEVLAQLQDKYTKAGKLDEALAIRARIRSLMADREQRREAADQNLKRD